MNKLVWILTISDTHNENQYNRLVFFDYKQAVNFRVELLLNKRFNVSNLVEAEIYEDKKAF